MMPTSAHGLTRSASGGGRAHARGFTLIEILIVLLIIGIAIGAVSLSFTQDDRRILSTESERLALLLQRAQDDAIFTGKAIAWSSDGAGYGFLRRGKDDWTPVEDDDVYRARKLPANVRVAELRINNVVVKQGELLIFAPGGLALPFQAVMGLRQGDAASVYVEGDAIGRVRVRAADAAVAQAIR